MKRALKTWVESVLRRRGYELKEVGAPLRGYEASLAYAKARGLSPSTVFDIGVGRGTPWLYDAFPNAKLVLFEPLPVFESELNEIVRRYDADLHKIALSSDAGAGTAEFNLNIGYPTSSSLLQMDPEFAQFAVAVQSEHRFERQTVAIDTLDHLNHYKPPFVLKLDVEGAEKQVLEGGKRTLEDTEFLIAEISVMRRQSGEPSFAEKIGFLDDCGFELFDIPSIAQTNDNGQLIYLDAAFVKKGSYLWPR
jgi:FkbM family methyltransferase